jgi:hypothetical protein
LPSYFWRLKALAVIFKDAFESYLRNTDVSSRKFATLGPNGTSSRHAAEKLALHHPAQIELFDTYEKAAQTVIDNPENAALIVANAYAQINRFYISHDFCPVGAFFNDTPAYVVASTSAEVLDRPSLCVATHPAPSHLIHGSIDHPDIRVVNADSTHLAAEQTILGQCDACLTTQVAAEIFGLETLSVALPAIPMLWTVFINKDYEKLEYGTESCHRPVR